MSLYRSFVFYNTQYYIDGIEYDNNELLFAMTEEGRASKKSNGSFTYDYFLKDHLGNVRVILGTDNTNQSVVYPAATMETMSAATENTYYSNLDKVRSFTPVGFNSIKKNEKVAHLKGTDPNRQIGPSITIKVNSGDKISLTAQSFYPDNTSSQRTGLAETALSQLVNAIINPAGLSDKGKAFAADNLRSQGFDKSTGYQYMMSKLPNSDYARENDRPKAYMVWMLFDNEMKLVKTGKSSGARQIPEGAGQVKQMAESDIVMDQGGFLTAYTVNESPASVYIDNFQLSQTSGLLLEENHYYPFGMLNEGLTHSEASSPINNYKYNDKELQSDLSLQLLDYGARFYDPQIGRWHSVDPLAELTRTCSPYIYGVNNPIRFVDPDGMESISTDKVYNEFDYEKEFYHQLNWLEEVTDVKESVLSWASGCTGGDDVSSEGVGNSGVSSNEQTNGKTPTKIKIGHVGEQVMEPLSGILDYVGAILFGRTFTDENGIRYSVDFNGKATGIAPITGMAPVPAFKGGSYFIKGVGNIDKQIFHRIIKKNILKEAGEYQHMVGTNPDVFVKNGKIFLEGSKFGPYPGKIYQTSLQAVDFFINFL